MHNHPSVTGERLKPRGQCPDCDADYVRLTTLELRRRVQLVLLEAYPTGRKVGSLQDYDVLMQALTGKIIDELRNVLWPPGGVHTVGLLAEPRRL